MKLYLFTLLAAAMLTAYVTDAWAMKCYSCDRDTNPCSDDLPEIITCPEVSEPNKQWTCGRYEYNYDNGTIIEGKGCFQYSVGGGEVCYDYNDEFAADNLVSSSCGWCVKDLCNCKRENGTTTGPDAECMF